MKTSRWIASGACALALAPTLHARQTALSVQEAKLRGADTNSGDRLGTAVALYGNTVIVGAPNADPNERGAAYVFVRANGGWTREAKLVATLGTSGDFDHFGAAVALEGDVALVGAPDWGTEDGHVYVFRRNGTTWNAEAVLGPPTYGFYYRFGSAVALSGSTLAASAPLFGANHEGAIAIYNQIAGTWTFDEWLIDYSAQPESHFGEHLAIAPASVGMRVIATAGTTGVESWSRTASGWHWNTIFGITASTVAYSGTTFAIGDASATVGGNAQAGQVFMYAYAGSSPGYQGTLTASDADAGDRFGQTLAVDGGKLVVGAPFDDQPGKLDRGAAYVFERVGAAWVFRTKLVADDAAAGDHFGASVDISGTEVAVGAPDAATPSGALSGSAYAERFGYPTLTYCTSGVSAAGCSATISSAGTPSLSYATAFSIQVANLDGQRTGLLFYGVSGPQAFPWSDTSWLCVKSPLQRTVVQSTGGNANACDGAMVLDWNAFATQNPTALGQPFTLGEQLWTQAWYRDPASAKTTELSNALGFVLLP